MSYLHIKHAHITFAIISISFFLIRAWWASKQSSLLQNRWVKTLPHINDTLLLGCAIYLAATIQQYPFVHHWLTAKVIGLLAYIGFGTVAIKRGKLWAAVAAALCFAYIFTVARSHSAWPF
ncbi:SirB2 family protein [Porticoccus sp. W117]|uniref:SirB2 family protein n=1 Tax=Porticoccus sp. W117 TaxID=3054777 RepID=UPI002591909A|nr:SirB2 family protein [Porticoccus sp. W117]MDM3871970.1 SirB2 family protein [Porticoccus sp. W117]